MPKVGIRALGVPFVIVGLVSFVGCHKKAPESRPIAAAVAVDLNGNRVVVGGFRDRIALGGIPLESAGGSDIFVAILSTAGTRVSTPQRYGGPGDDTATGVAIAPDGAVVIGGTFQGTLNLGNLRIDHSGNRAQEHGVFVAKLSFAGKPLWVTAVGEVNSPANVSVSVQANGTIVAGVALSGAFELGDQKVPALSEQVLAIELTAAGRIVGAPMLLAVPAGTPTCAHSACEVGDPIDPACDTSGCVSNICTKYDHSCCAAGGTWSSTCVGYVTSKCNRRCGTGSDLCTTSTMAMYYDAVRPCTDTVCGHIPHCCKTTWDQPCTNNLAQDCHMNCAQ